jgi:HAD superfamily hydrolase (TIGR01490 family)
VTQLHRRPDPAAVAGATAVTGVTAIRPNTAIQPTTTSGPDDESAPLATTTGPATTGPATTGPATTGPATTGPVTADAGQAAAVPSAAVAGAASAAAATVDQPGIGPDRYAGAFFDVDNTLMRGASIYYFAKGLAARKMFGTRDMVKMVVGQLLFRIRGAENPGHIDAARQAALAFVAGQKVSDIIALGEEIYDDTMAARVWEGTRELTQAHLDAGQRVWLVTATPVELADILARRLGLTGALGTVAETSDGIYTGRLAGGLLHGTAKAQAVLALAEREDLDLSQCSAYSDSVNDLPMLELVGQPNAVNPDARLRVLARERGWPVYDFRKGRKATIAALPVAAGAGVIVGGLAAGIAVRRHRTPG